MVFRKGGTISQDMHWYYAGQEIEIVNSFNYLGVIFSSGGSFIQNAKYLADKALKAMHSLFNITKDIDTPINILLQLFDSVVASILYYGCETWGFLNAESIERIHRKFLKYLVNVKMSTCNYAIYKEFGRYHLSIERQIRIIKYWFKLINIQDSNCILNAVFNDMLHDMKRSTPRQESWLYKVKNLLDNNGFSDVWTYPNSVNKKKFLPIFKRRLIDNFINETRRNLEASSSMSLYKEINQNFELSPYLTKIVNRKHRNALAKLRLSSHNLKIESGRHTSTRARIARENRKCIICNSNDIEDEFHFVLICPVFNDIRRIYMKRYYTKNPSMFKFLQLLNSGGKQLNNLALYVTKAFKLRNETLNNIIT